MSRDQLLQEIGDQLGILAYQVEVRNSISLFDLNVSAEDFYAGLLNIIYGLDLVNLNSSVQNAKAIDLGDKIAKKAIQVTSENSVEKIRETVRKFQEDGRENEYSNLTVLQLKKKKNYKKLPECEGFRLEVIDYRDLIKDIKTHCSDIQQLKRVKEYINSELASSNHTANKLDDIIDTFADHATRYIAEVAEKIVFFNRDYQPRGDFQRSDLRDKFTRMKCTTSYRNKFNRFAAFFPDVDNIVNSDAVEGGANTIVTIIGAIENLYFQLLDRSENGDLLHNQILASLLRNGDYSPQMQLAADTLVFYTINACGIFNEQK